MSTSPESGNARLKELCSQRLSPGRLILASNRGPIEYYFTEDKQLRLRRGSGGIVTALSSLSNYVELNWIASAMGEGDREVARRAQGRHFKVPSFNNNLYLNFVVSPRDTYHKFYGVICNPLLWFLQHYMWNSPRTPNIDQAIYDAWENGYVLVNKAFAQAVIAEAAANESPSIVMLNDYHLYLTSSYIREQMPNLVIQQFVHIPWPSPTYWQLLPSSMRQAIFSSLCTTDIVGLQTMRDVRNFLYCCQSFMDEADIDYRQQTVQLNGHILQVKAYPVSVDVAGLKKLVSSARLKEDEERLRHLCGEQTIVRVDMAEPNKNIIRGFEPLICCWSVIPSFGEKKGLHSFSSPYQNPSEAIPEVYARCHSTNGRYK